MAIRQIPGIYVGSGGPGVIANSANDDFYIDKAAPALYVKVAGVWILIVSGGGVGGPTGPAGPSGPAGVTGATGPAGVSGATGPVGVSGAAGAAGVSGATGAAGPAGVSGATGATGVVGVSGATGAIGVSGATGAIGVSGATGPQGVTGPLGPPGIDGSDGDPGVAGPLGSSGPIGIPGGPITFPYTFSTASGGDPGAGGLRLSGASPQNTSTTTYVSDTDGNGNNIIAALATFDDSTSGIRGHWRVIHATNSAKWILWQLTSTGDVTTFYILSGEIVASSSANPFANGDPVLLQFERTGDMGATGPTGIPGIDGDDGEPGVPGPTGASGTPGDSCRVYNSAPIAISSGVITALTFDTERFDTANMHSTSSNTGRISFINAGKYMVGANVAWVDNSVGNRAISIRLNGSTVIATAGIAAVASDQQESPHVSTFYNFAAGDYVEVTVEQTSGASLNIYASGNSSPEFWAYMIGGPVGATGPTGPSGGPTGATGPMGMPGIDGDDGEQGPPGLVGPAPTGAWTAYTCTLTSSGTAPNVGATGFQTGRWMRIGRTVFMQFRINMSGAGFAAGTGNYSIALPVNASTSIATARVGLVTVGSTNDSGSSIMLYVATATTLQGIYSTADPSGTATTWGAGNPVALATACNLFGYVTYEAAAD